jgi:hypothetical protein
MTGGKYRISRIVRALSSWRLRHSCVGRRWVELEGKVEIVNGLWERKCGPFGQFGGYKLSVG